MTPSPKPLSQDELEAYRRPLANSAVTIMEKAIKYLVEGLYATLDDRDNTLTSQAREIATLTTAAESATKMLGNATRLVAELEAEIAVLKGRERTAGTNEICKFGPERYDNYYEHQWIDCVRHNCPIRTAAQEGK